MAKRRKKAAKTGKLKIEDYVEVCDSTLGVYGDTHFKEERDGHFDFATFTLDPEWVMVRRSSLEALIQQAQDFEVVKRDSVDPDLRVRRITK